MRDLRIILPSRPQLIPFTHRANQSYSVSIIIKTILLLCACADGPQCLRVHIAELALGERYKVRATGRLALTEGRRIMGGQIALDQPMTVEDRDILSARAKGGAAFGWRGALVGDVVADGGWIMLCSKTERRSMGAETCKC